MLNLNDMTYTSERTGSSFQGQGAFNAQPDQIIKMTDDRKFVYFTEDGGSSPGAHARDSDGKYYTLFRAIPGGIYAGDETVGIAFSPDRKRFYCGYQEKGVLLEVFNTQRRSNVQLICSMFMLVFFFIVELSIVFCSASVGKA